MSRLKWYQVIVHSLRFNSLTAKRNLTCFGGKFPSLQTTGNWCSEIQTQAGGNTAARSVSDDPTWNQNNLHNGQRPDVTQTCNLTQTTVSETERWKTSPQRQGDSNTENEKHDEGKRGRQRDLRGRPTGEHDSVVRCTQVSAAFECTWKVNTLLPC